MEWINDHLAIIITVSIILLIFLLIGHKDIAILLRRPNKTMGSGFSRVWAVARVTFIEAWANRVWLAPVLWLLVSIVLLATVRGYDDTELIPLYVQVLLWGQQIIVMVMLWIMACMSLPRDRERKIIISNASKPLSRLEILLGKMTGLSVVAFFLFFTMGLVTWGMLKFEDGRIRANAQIQATLANSDYSVKDNVGQAARPEVLQRLANEGTLFAYNYLTVPPGGMSIVGRADAGPNGMTRFIKGGSYENVIYTFSPRIFAKPGALLAPIGQRPYFKFYFPFAPYYKNLPMPPRVQIQVTAVRTKARLRSQTKTVTLGRDFTGGWEPDDPDALFTPSNDYNSFAADDDRGDIELTVTCPTQGVFLQLFEGAAPDPVTHTLPNNAVFNVYAAGDRDETGVWQPPLPHPEVRGFDRHDRQEIQGPDQREMNYLGITNPLDMPTEVAVFRFSSKDLHKVPVENGNFTLALNMDVDRNSNQLLDTHAHIRVYNEENPTAVQTFDPIVMEKRVVPVSVPESFLGDQDPSKRGDLIVLLQCVTTGHSLSLLDDSVRLEEHPSFFIVTLMKSEIVLFLATVLLIVVSVTCSVRLGWAVALLCTAGCYTLGYCASMLGHAIDNGGLGALNYANVGSRGAAYHFFDKVFEGLWNGLSILSSLMPNITSYDYLEFISQSRNMPFSVLAEYFLLTLFFILPFIALGYLLLRKQELG